MMTIFKHNTGITQKKMTEARASVRLLLAMALEIVRNLGELKEVNTVIKLQRSWV